MMKRQIARVKALLPDGKPKWIRVYDNGGVDAPNGSGDRYSVLFTGRYRHNTGGEFWLTAMSGAPYHPQGICLHNGYPYQCDTIGKSGRPWEVFPPAVGRRCHLGKRIRFDDLPADCQRVVLDDYCELWSLPRPATAPVPSVSVAAG